jgi:hypothetical protein
MRCRQTDPKSSVENGGHTRHGVGSRITATKDAMRDPATYVGPVTLPHFLNCTRKIRTAAFTWDVHYLWLFGISCLLFLLASSTFFLLSRKPLFIADVAFFFPLEHSLA